MLPFTNFINDGEEGLGKEPPQVITLVRLGWADRWSHPLSAICQDNLIINISILSLCRAGHSLQAGESPLSPLSLLFLGFAPIPLPFIGLLPSC